MKKIHLVIAAIAFQEQIRGKDFPKPRDMRFCLSDFLRSE